MTEGSCFLGNGIKLATLTQKRFVSPLKPDASSILTSLSLETVYVCFPAISPGLDMVTGPQQMQQIFIKLTNSNLNIKSFKWQCTMQLVASIPLFFKSIWLPGYWNSGKRNTLHQQRYYVLLKSDMYSKSACLYSDWKYSVTQKKKKKIAIPWINPLFLYTKLISIKLVSLFLAKSTAVLSSWGSYPYVLFCFWHLIISCWKYSY